MTNKKIHFWAFVLSVMLLFSGCAAQGEEAGKNPNEFQGTIEAEEVDINAKIPGRIEEIKVEEGQEIQEGDIIALIDIKDILAKKEGLVAQANAAKAGIEAAEAQYDAALGQLAAAQATLEKAVNGARSQEIAKAQANYDIMKKNYERVKALYEEGAVSKAQLDEIETKMNVALQDLNLAKEGARQEDIDAARAQVQAVSGTAAAAQSNIAAAREKYQQALAGVQEVDTYIEDATIKSPLSGLVTMLNVSKGELVSSGMSIATITNLQNIWVEIQVKETELSKFKEGQEVNVRVPAYKDQTFKGKVVRINKKPDFAVKKASNENGEFDLVCYGIKIKLDNSKQLLRPGMTAFVQLTQ
jgi:HlyD family secretion protein